MFSPQADIVNFEKIVNLKTSNPNLKIMCSIGGWDQGSLIFSIISNNALSRTKFSMAVFDFIKKHGCDGVNIVWLHPSQRRYVITKMGSREPLSNGVRVGLATES